MQAFFQNDGSNLLQNRRSTTKTETRDVTEDCSKKLRLRIIKLNNFSFTVMSKILVFVCLML